MSTIPASPVTPASPVLFRILRVLGLLAAYIAPFVWLGIGVAEYGSEVSYDLLGFLTPSPLQMLILGALGYQAFRLVKPWHGGDRRAAMHDSNLLMEVFLIGFGLLAYYASMSFFVHPLVPLAIALFGVALIVGFRTTTAIDGAAQKIWVLKTIPKAYAFSDVKGLGTIEIRSMRGGTHVGTTYYVGLFFPQGDPKQLLRLDTAHEVQAKIVELHQLTGVPIATRS